MEAIVRSVDYQLARVSSMPRVEIEVKIALAVPLEVHLTEPAKCLWAWFLNPQPGKRYRKLLSRAVAADSEYVKLENRIKTVWRNA